MKFADFSFRKRHDTNACKAHQLEEGGDMLLIATDAIERLREHNVEFAFPRTLEEFLITRTEVARAPIYHGPCILRRASISRERPAQCKRGPDPQSMLRVGGRTNIGRIPG